MSGSGHEQLDVNTLAAERQVVRRHYRAPELPRLAEAGLDGTGWVDVVLRFSAVGDGRVGCDLALSGSLTLQCQRCLQPYEQALAGSSRLVFVEDGSDEPGGEADETEAYPVKAGWLDLMELVEEEALLAVPLVARHEPGAEGCGGDHEHVADDRAEEEPRQRPFAGLKDLLKS
ncbi:MAG: YceD family protein [Steroidobacteraceae bacterium]